MTDEHTPSRREHRLSALWILFALWAGVIVFQMARIMVFERDQYLLAISGSGWITELVPAGRGRILDAQGRPLAWSTRHFRLLWHIPRDPRTAENQWRHITESVDPDPQWNPDRIRLFLDQQVILDHDLSSREFQTLVEHDPNNGSLTVESYFKRHCANLPGLTQRMGRTIVENGTEIGVSGFEKQYDQLLRGTPGVIRTFVSDNGETLRHTRKIVRNVRPGYDVYMPFTIRRNNQTVQE